MTKKELGFNTRAVHAGYPHGFEQSATPPIFQTAAYHFQSTANAAGIFAGTVPGFVYSRINNPTVDILEKRMADLEGAEAGLCTATGMAAIFMTALHLADCGDEFVSGNRVYGGTFHLFNCTLRKKCGINVRFVKDQSDLGEWKQLITKKTKFIYAETPGNPTNEIVDIAALATVAHRHNLPLVIDNTICTPALQTPLAHGADLVIHSLTKYIGGSGSTLGGAIVGGRSLIDGIRFNEFRDIGPSLQALDAWIILLGLPTLELRMRRHSENALVVAKFLEAHPAVKQVHYVGLPSHPQHALACKQMRGASSLFSFELVGDVSSGARFIDSLDLVGHMANLGDVRTMAIHPASTTHEQLGPDERRKAGIGDTLVRISVGLEDPEDVIADLKLALAKI